MIPIDRTQWLAGRCTLPSSGTGRRKGKRCKGVDRACCGRMGSGMRPPTESAPSSRCIARVAGWKLHVTKRWCRQTHRLALPGYAAAASAVLPTRSARRRCRLATPPIRRPIPSSLSIARSGWLEAARYQAVVQADAKASAARGLIEHAVVVWALECGHRRNPPRAPDASHGWLDGSCTLPSGGAGRRIG